MVDIHIDGEEVLQNMVEDDVGSLAESTSTKSSTDIHLKKKVAPRSSVWLNFTLVESRAICNHCTVASYSYTSSTQGTSTLLTHLKKCSAYQKAKESNSLPVVFNQMHYRELIAKAIIRHDYAFSWVEHEANREIHAYLNNQVKTICRNTAKSDCLKLHQNLKAKLKETLSKVPGRICLTSDMWTSCQTLGYMCLTAHYVDSDWKLNSKVLNFVHLETGHTGHDMFSVLLELLCEWGIQHKIFALTLDNASSNDKMQDHLKRKLNQDKYLVQDGKYFHIRCAAHVLNLIVKDGLKLIEKSITKIRESVKYVNWSEARKRSFTTSVNITGINEKKGLWLDVDTRWNSTYHMLDRALLYRDAFVDLSSSGSGYKYLPSEEEWEKVEQLRDVLEPLSDITDLFSGSDYPTANLYFENVWRIAMLLKELDQSDYLELRTMAKAMKAKFDKYWFSSEGQEYNSLFAFALVLDPRHKRQVLKHCYLKLYDTEREAINKFDEVLYKLNNLYEEYDLTEINSLHDAPTPTTTSNKSTSSKTGNRKRKFDFAGITIEKSSSMETTKNKLHLYLEEPQLQHDPNTPFDVLAFWKENEIKHGKLSHLARDILTVPLTTVASESTFSIGGRVLNKWRSSLLPEHAEALITSRSWMFGYDVDEPENVGSEVDWTIK